MARGDGGIVDFDGGGNDRPVSIDGGVACADAAGVKKAVGQPCGCASDCASNFCVDGFCCTEACSGGCRTCGQTGSEGTCVARSSGANPRSPSDCEAAAASTCSFDGKCDGAGACRKHVSGTVCKAGVCDGDAVTGQLVCDGQGSCRPGATMICSPYSCDPKTNACVAMCSGTNQCVAGHACDSTGSCGKRLGGGACTKASDCLSNFCANNICCNVACQGPCVSCALPGLEGTCWPISPGMPDPNAICKDQGAASCGTNGLCDGVGGCSRYPAETECVAAACSGNRLNTPGTCDGLGTCRPPGLQNCSPFMCRADACTSTCEKDTDCDSGIACVNGTCGPKQLGQTCSKASECKSGQCVDGLCCDSACTGGCRSCALTSSPGHCAMVAAGNGDPRNTCKDAGATSCGTNGKCDGAGSCQLYNKNTTCAGEACSQNVYTPFSTCDGAGRCVKPPSLPCAPYTCNGTRCFMACSADTQCLMPNRCVSSSCGLANNGGACSVGSQCKSGFCAQGVCCDKACNGACMSCGLSGSLGTCTTVANGANDPAGLCKDQGSTSCGTNGKCQAGACQKYGSGTSCAAATCPAGSSTFTAGSTCDGNGTCVKPPARSCAPFLCGAGACKPSCTVNTDCASPAVCTNGSCGLKDPGRTCADGSECKSGFCRQGVCCSTECNSTCKSCNASASTAGTCTNVASGSADPAGTCKDAGAASCGTTGVCDGNGACQRYAAGTVCVGSSCPAGMSTQANARTCDGAGTCRAGTTVSCAPYLCNGTNACNSACTADGDCVTNTICDPKTNLCGTKKRQGQGCSQTGDCLTGLTCVDGVCCGTASCAACQACNVTGSLGTCASVPAGNPDPRGTCGVVAGMPCGNTGACDGTGKCQLASAGVTCAAETCSGSTSMSARTCDGKGVCGPAISASCSPFVCGGTTCKTTCSTDNDCIAPNTCQGSGASKNCTLKANGVACTAGNQCISGSCVDNVCCGSASCPACQSCNVGNSAGACAPLAGGATDARCGGGTTTCGKTNSCDGAGACANSTAMCAAAKCTGSSFTPAAFCSGGTSTCPPQAAMSCGAFGCTTAGCKTTCAASNDCATGSFCDTTTHLCMNGGGLGAGCTTDDQCATGNCVDNVCCNTAGNSCPLCQACNVAGKEGTCSFIGTGNPEPHNACAPDGICGNTGACAANQTCAKAPSSTMCGSASCSAGTEKKAAFCDGAGNCATAASSACDPFVCGPNACKDTCVTDLDCITGHYCKNGACKPKLSPGTACSTTDECLEGVCGSEGVCCDSDCSGTCVSCKRPTSPGTCKPLDPGTPCGPAASCADTVFTGNACDGTGMCQPTNVDCSMTATPTTCDPTQGCIPAP